MPAVFIKGMGSFKKNHPAPTEITGIKYMDTATVGAAGGADSSTRC